MNATTDKMLQLARKASQSYSTLSSNHCPEFRASLGEAYAQGYLAALADNSATSEALIGLLTYAQAQGLKFQSGWGQSVLERAQNAIA